MHSNGLKLGGALKEISLSPQFLDQKCKNQRFEDIKRFESSLYRIGVQDPELECLLRVKKDLCYVLIFFYAILDAKSIALMDAVLVVKDIIVIYRNNETILILISLKRYFPHSEKSILNLSLP